MPWEEGEETKGDCGSRRGALGDVRATVAASAT
jgi:hypothetical protein